MQKPIDLSDWKTVVYKSKTPYQPHGLDCGVFMCKTADYISQDAQLDAQLDFTITDMKVYLRRRMSHDRRDHE